MEKDTQIKLDRPIIDAILIENGPEAEIAKRVSDEFGKFVSVGMVRKVLMSDERRRNIETFKGSASMELDTNMGIVKGMINDLLEMFGDEVLSPKQRLDAASELRQYIKLQWEAAGIHDREGDTMWVVGNQWDMGGS